MKSSLLLVASGILFAIDWPSLPSFDLQAALIVGAIVVVAVTAVIVVAIALPFIAIEAGTIVVGGMVVQNVIGAAAAVAGIAVVSGTIAGTAAGFYRGRQGDIEIADQIEKIKQVSNQLDIYFEPSSSDPKQAADFQCTLVVYEETDLSSQQPTITVKRFKITANDSEEFYGQVSHQMQKWFGKRVQADSDRQNRRAVVYMSPYPGEPTYDRLKQIIEQNGDRPCVIKRTEGVWESALPR